jgi:hypothetical protein
MSRPDALTSLRGGSALMVLLPGALMTPQHMVDAGMFDAVDHRHLDLDLMALDLQALGGCNRQALQVLRDEVLAPERDRYGQIWLTGISRGGQLALSCLAEEMAPVDGVCLLAPYPGSRLTINAIRRAGGLDTWVPDATELEDPEFRMWRWLKQPVLDIPLFVGYGVQDRFADSMQTLIERLPMAQRVEVEGGHDWAAWMPLWSQFLDVGHFGVQS